MTRLPDWPLLMTRERAAQAVDMTVADFERAVSAGDMPLPILIDGKDRWAKRTIEAAIARLAGEVESDWRKEQRAMNEGVDWRNVRNAA